MGQKPALPSNETLARFLAIKQEIKRLEKEQSAIKSQIEAVGGNFDTGSFLVTTTQYETNRVCSADELLLKVGFVECNNLGLIKTSTASRLNVERVEVAGRKTA